jgi:hypothetical protein
MTNNSSIRSQQSSKITILRRATYFSRALHMSIHTSGSRFYEKLQAANCVLARNSIIFLDVPIISKKSIFYIDVIWANWSPTRKLFWRPERDCQKARFQFGTVQAASDVTGARAPVLQPPSRMSLEPAQ